MTLYPEGQRLFYIREETVVGTPESTPYLRYAEDVSVDHEVTINARTGDTAGFRGFKGVAGQETNPVSWASELGPVTVVDANSRPIIHDTLIACGFELSTDVASDPKYLIYTRVMRDHGAATIHVRDGADDANEYWRHLLAGVRASGTLQIGASDRWMWQAEGNAASGTRELISAALGTPDYDGSIETAPAVGVNNYIHIVELGADGAYDGCVHSIEVDTRMVVTERNTPECRHVDLRPRDGVLVNLTVEDTSDFDWYGLRDAQTALVVTLADRDGTFTGVAPSVAGDYVVIPFTARISAIAPSTNAALRTLDVTLEEIFPEASADGGGLQTANGFKIVFVTKA